MTGMMMSPTSEVTMAPNAAPMMTPTARSTTLPFIANSRNSFSTIHLHSSHKQQAQYSVTSDGVSKRPNSVDQAGMHHRAANRGPRGFGDRNHGKPQLLVDLAEQRQRVFYRRGIGFDEQIHVQRHQLVVNLQGRRHIALLPGRMKFRTQPRRDIR